MIGDNTIEAAKPQQQTQRKPEPDWEDAQVVKQHSLYTADRWNGRHYYADFQQKTEVMRTNESRITTRLDDRQTVGTMLDLAEARGWSAINIRGSEDFKRETWVQAQLRGIETQGYRPQETDRQELTRRQAAAAPVQDRTKPVPAEAGKNEAHGERRRQRDAEASVWGEVERTGQQARAKEAPAASQTAAPADRPRAKAEAA